jgi:hypothetical protein
VVGPGNVKRTVALPVRKPNAAYRSREHLTEREVERLIEATKGNCCGIAAVSNWRISGPPSWLTCAGSRWTSNTPSCTSAGSRMARQPHIH